MADANKFVQAQNFSLAGSGVVIGATAVILKSFAGIDGTLLTMADFGSLGFATLEPGNGELEEQICFTGVTQNVNGTATLTGVSNVLFVAPYTQTSGVLKTHAGSTTLVISNTSGFYDALSGKANDETITGTWTFPSTDPTRAGIGSDTDTAVATAFVTLGQLSRQAISGASNASTTVKGIVELATQAEVDARSITGATGALLVPTPDVMRSTLLSDYKVDTGAANAYVITPVPAITAYTVGQIFSFKVVNTNTGASTLNVSALGTKNIFFNGLALIGGEILANNMILVEYDGTQFQLISPRSNTTPVGSVNMYIGSSAPSGWLLCDATSYLRADYAALFAIIGTTYGSADGTHFNVPDMRGRVPIGVGTGTGGAVSGTGLPTGGSALTVVARAGWKGEETHVLTVGELAAHHHSGNASTASAGAGAVHVGNGFAFSGTNDTNDTGSDTAHNNIQPTMGINFIIKT